MVTCSATMLYSLPRGTATPKRWHGGSAVTALSLDADQALRVAAIQVALEQRVVLPGDGFEHYDEAAPAFCQPPASPTLDCAIRKSARCACSSFVTTMAQRLLPPLRRAPW